MIVAVAVCMSSGAYAQSAGAGNGLALAEATAPPKDITLTLKNDCTNHLSVFAGSKKEVFDGKSVPVGGLSTNTLYLKEGDVVCIMADAKTIEACAIAKEGATKMEINKSGNGFIK